MTDTSASRAASLPHLRRAKLSKGEAVTLPLELTSTYYLPGEPAGFRDYGRYDNATWDAVEEMLAHLEGAPCVAFPSGMAAITAVMFSQLKAGDRVLLPADGYHTTRTLADRYLTKLGIAVETRPVGNFLAGGLTGYRLVFIETPSNPLLDLCDIAAITETAHAAGALVVADNTTMTPFGQRPLDLGVDLLVAADTKVPNGHSDTLFGHVASRDDKILATVRDWRDASGAIPGPFEAWLVHRGLETLELRFDRMCTTAALIAPRLQTHPAVRAVRFPGLPDHPGHNLALRQMLRFGFLIGLTLNAAEAAEAFINTCPLIQPATSFGGIHTSAERRARWGDAVDPGFVRLSVGCEPSEELWAALKTSLDGLA
jgi:cystathionine gamma-lyase